MLRTIVSVEPNARKILPDYAKGWKEHERRWLHQKTIHDQTQTGRVLSRSNILESSSSSSSSELATKKAVITWHPLLQLLAENTVTRVQDTGGLYRIHRSNWGLFSYHSFMKKLKCHSKGYNLARPNHLDFRINFVARWQSGSQQEIWLQMTNGYGLTFPSYLPTEISIQCEITGKR